MNKPNALGRESRQRIYDFIRKFKVEHGGKSPTIAEIKAGCHNSSTSVVSYHLGQLKKQGALDITGIPRSRSRISLPGEQYILPAPVEIR